MRSYISRPHAPRRAASSRWTVATLPPSRGDGAVAQRPLLEAPGDLGSRTLEGWEVSTHARCAAIGPTLLSDEESDVRAAGELVEKRPVEVRGRLAGQRRVFEALGQHPGGSHLQGEVVFALVPPAIAVLVLFLA